MLKIKEVTTLLLVLSLTLSPSILHSEEEKPYGGTLVIGDSHKASVINPILANSDLSTSVGSLIFSRLIGLNKMEDLDPELAESWKISDNGRVYTFHLRQGIKFHDHTELTSADLLYTFERIKDPETRCPYRLAVSNVESFAAPDAYTFQIVLKEPQSSLIYELQREILPKHLYVGTDIRNNPFNLKPVGTGPFKFKQWTEDDQIILEANENYFEGRPHLDRIIFKSYKSKEDVWSAFMRGEIDMARFISVEDYELTKKDPAFKAYAVQTPDYYVIFYNLDDPVVSDLQVRRAIAYAIDQKALIDEVEQGYGVESTGPFSSKSWAYNPKVQAIPYDPSIALTILDKIGRTHQEITIRMLVDARQEKMKKIALLLRQQLQEVGIRLQIELGHDDIEIKKRLSSGKIQARLGRFPGDELYPEETIKRWHSGFEGKGELWGTQFSDPEIDRLIELGRASQDKEISQKVYRDLHKMIYEKQFASFLYFPYAFHAVSKRVGGTDDFFHSMHMPDPLIKDFYISTKSSLKKRR